MNLGFGKCNVKRLSEKAGMGNWGAAWGGGKMGKREIKVRMMGMQGIRVGMWRIGVGMIFQVNL